MWVSGWLLTGALVAALVSTIMVVHSMRGNNAKAHSRWVATQAVLLGVILVLFSHICLRALGW